LRSRCLVAQDTRALDNLRSLVSGRNVLSRRHENRLFAEDSRAYQRVSGGNHCGQGSQVSAAVSLCADLRRALQADSADKMRHGNCSRATVGAVLPMGTTGTRLAGVWRTRLSRTTIRSL